MNKQQIEAAIKEAAAKGKLELMQLWQAVEWMNEYHLITYKHYQYSNALYIKTIRERNDEQ